LRHVGGASIRVQHEPSTETQRSRPFLHVSRETGQMKNLRFSQSAPNSKACNLPWTHCGWLLRLFPDCRWVNVWGAPSIFTFSSNEAVLLIKASRSQETTTEVLRSLF
jgi:hypothetical protein